ncbi:hypothetical protein AAE02nite_35940 [Adhaeribacter aerolatus]|uniref:Lipoprotein n=1 Tax=Adhaeribacter aerolatus TaxID=670289 RepID=A0A512B1V5_9BACT|nr:hypothetical protein [Adhaeribacter aerolatus]GEO05930.1 hypothetical protein AAE02nite_35940 [Adhaeribacter aerolatus]
MKKFTNVSSLFALLIFTSMLFFSSCSSHKQHFSFTPASPAYVKKQPSADVNITPTTTETPVTENTVLTASTAPEQAVTLPEIVALTEKAQPTLAKIAHSKAATSATAEVKTTQKLTLAQKVMLHKIQKQAKKLSNQSQKAESAAGPVSNRNAIALILIGLIVAVFGSFLGSLFYTLGVLILLVGLVLLILNYV